MCGHSVWVCTQSKEKMSHVERRKSNWDHVEENKRSLQHLLFPGGHPSKYWAGPTLLNFSDQTRTGVLSVVWSYAVAALPQWAFVCRICVNTLYEFAHEVKKRCQMWKEESQTEIMWKKKKRSLQHLVFPGGHPSKYWVGPTLLNFSDQTRTGVLSVVWS